jgi:DNA ligase-1
MLYLNGKSLLQQPLLKRRELLHASFRHTEGLLHFAVGLDHLENGDTTPIELFMQEACGAMCEGLMVKTLTHNATYEPSKRSLNWLKLKKDYIDGMGVCDSVDLVPIGGYHGRGKRTNVYGAYLMAVSDYLNKLFTVIIYAFSAMILIPMNIKVCARLELDSKTKIWLD